MKVKNSLSFFAKFILWLNCFLCVALLVSYLAPFVNPQKIWMLAFFGLAYPFFLAGNVLLIIYWLLRKKWYLLLSVICIASGWNIVKNNIGFDYSQSEPAFKNGDVIRMMTYNVHNFKRYGSNNDTSTKHEILQIIAGQQPDVIGFQEFYTRKRGQYNMRDSVIKILGSSNYYFEPIMFNNDEAIGVAIFTKFPIIAHGLIPIADKTSENSCLFIDVKKGNKIFRIYSIHLQSIGFDPDDYKYLSRISRQGKTDVSSTRRLGSKLKNAFLKRSSQVLKIKEHATQCPYPYIISGDFNDTPTSYAVNSMAKGLKNTFREKGFGFGRTYNGDFPNYQIDYIMTSQQFDIINYKIIEKKLSDHYPVRSDVLLR